MSKPAECEDCENPEGTAHDARGDKEIREEVKGHSHDDSIEWKPHTDKRDSSLRPRQRIERTPVVIHCGRVESILEQKNVKAACNEQGEEDC
jgi:hypothetical protein